MRKRDYAKTLKGKQPRQQARYQRAGQASSPGFKLRHVQMGRLVPVYVNLKVSGEARYSASVAQSAQWGFLRAINAADVA